MLYLYIHMSFFWEHASTRHFPPGGQCDSQFHNGVLGNLMWLKR